MCKESYFVKYMLKEIWLQIKFGEIFWGEVEIDALKGGGGCKQKEIIIAFSRRQKVKATSGYYI